MILQGQCSEYVFHLKLNDKEKKLAKILIKRLEIKKDDKKYLLEHLKTKEEGINFIETELVEPYTKIKTIILADRLKIDRKKLMKIAEKLK